ncbi:Triose phosphate/phosphate translocator, chloroplastic [Leucoagaricus sp. SymC.cos]|nr:Triose phosphate/phosphate translocator, chloroplastic [Leucoagaricus sp. SymC.cos]
MSSAVNASMRREGIKLSNIHAGKRKYPKARPPDLDLSAKLSSSDSVPMLLTSSSSADTLPEHTSPTSPKFHRSNNYFRSFTSLLLSRDGANLHAPQNSRAFWIGLWFFLNFSLTLSNKVVLNRFPFPYSITALHALSGCIGTWFVMTPEDRLPTLTSKEIIVLVVYSSLYTINIVVSNVSLQLVTVPFHQVVRSSAPFFTLILSGILLHSRITRPKLISLIPVVAGVGLATYGDYYYTLSGFLLTLLGTFLASLKTVVTNILQSPHSNSHQLTSASFSHLNHHYQDKDTSISQSQHHHPRVRTSKGHDRSSSISITVTLPPSTTYCSTSPFLSSIPKLHLTPIQLLHLLSPLALFQCTLLAIYFNEHTKLLLFLSSSSPNVVDNNPLSSPSSLLGNDHTNASLKALNANGIVAGISTTGTGEGIWRRLVLGSMIPSIAGLVTNALMAFALNVVSFHANRKVGALGISVAANVKQVLTILSSVVLFNLTITRMNAFGILLTLIGGAWYARVDLRESSLRRT